MDSDLIPLFGMLMVFGLPIGGWITVRVLQHRERMAMLQRGIVPPPDSRMWRRGAWRGMQAPPGPAWTPPPTPPWTPQAGAVPPQPPPNVVYDPESAQYAMNNGIKTTMVGIALLIGLSFIGWRGDGVFHPGPWLLGGLIPMFVGIAQIITALMAGAQLMMRPPMGPPGMQPPPAARPYGGAPGNAEPPPPYPGQGGVRFEELARPVKPPDRI